MYNYSTDYERLWELCQKSKRPACIVNGEIFFHERSNLDKQTAISIWEEDCLRWIDPQPVAEEEKEYVPTKFELNNRREMEVWDNGFKCGAASIIEKLKGLQGYELFTNQWYVSKEDIKSIINQSK